MTGKDQDIGKTLSDLELPLAYKVWWLKQTDKPLGWHCVSICHSQRFAENMVAYLTGRVGGEWTSTPGYVVGIRVPSGKWVSNESLGEDEEQSWIEEHQEGEEDEEWSDDGNGNQETD